MLNPLNNTTSGTFPGTCLECVVMPAWFFQYLTFVVPYGLCTVEGPVFFVAEAGTGVFLGHFGTGTIFAEVLVFFVVVLLTAAFFFLGGTGSLSDMISTSLFPEFIQYLQTFSSMPLGVLLGVFSPVFHMFFPEYLVLHFGGLCPSFFYLE